MSNVIIMLDKRVDVFVVSPGSSLCWNSCINSGESAVILPFK